MLSSTRSTSVLESDLDRLGLDSVAFETCNAILLEEEDRLSLVDTGVGSGAGTPMLFEGSLLVLTADTVAGSEDAEATGSLVVRLDDDDVEVSSEVDGLESFDSSETEEAEG